MSNKPLPLAVYIQTENYLLKSLTVNDVNDEFVDWLTKDGVALGLNIDTRHWNTEVFKNAVLKQYDNISHYMIGIFDLANNELVGFFSFDINYAHKVAYITSAINAQKVAPKAVLFETTNVVVNFFLEQRGIEKVSARVLSNNLGMVFCFIGSKTFELEGRLKQECLALDGTRVDILIFSTFKQRT